jgi:hypothetical protein
LFYSGHGHPENGAWCVHLKEPGLEISEELINFEELWNVIYQSGFKGGIEITSDSCYSGKVCILAEKYWSNPEKLRNIEYLRVFASADAKKQACWGKYTQMKKDIRSKVMSQDEARVIQKAYSDIYGLVNFDSLKSKVGKPLLTIFEPLE